MMSLERKGYFYWIGRSLEMASEPARQMGFSDALNKGLVGLYLHCSVVSV